MKIVLACIMILFAFRVNAQEIREILEKSIRELDKIETFEYIVISQSTAAFDTTDYVRKYSSKIKGIRNKGDTVVGYNYIIYDNEKNIYLIYDFAFSVTFNWYNKTVELTDYRKYPERRNIIYAPIYLTAKTMLDFALNGNQADIVVISDKTDTLVFDILFNQNRYEFHGKEITRQGRTGYSWSTYRVWLNKKNFLPFKILRKQEHQKSCKEIVWSRLNAISNFKIDALAGIPGDFTIREYPKKRGKVDLSGQTAPDLKLTDLTDNSLSISDYRGKVVLLEFTSVGCGPCHLAIPELVKLRNDFDKSKFEILSIEAYIFNNKKDIFRKYVVNSGINYPFFIGNLKTTESYKVPGVPYFLIIDKGGIIRESVIGFDKDSTMVKLRNSIKALIE